MKSRRGRSIQEQWDDLKISELRETKAIVEKLTGELDEKTKTIEKLIKHIHNE